LAGETQEGKSPPLWNATPHPGIPRFLFLDNIEIRKLAIVGGIAMAVSHIIMAGVVDKFSGS
jgi:hypothetical protein